MTHGVSYLQNELDSVQHLKDKVQAMSLEKALDEKVETISHPDSDEKVGFFLFPSGSTNDISGAIIANAWLG